MKRYLFILLIILLSATSVFGAVSWTGNTCTITGDASLAQLNDCLTGAVNGIVAQGKTGEITVQLPTDAETWSSGITINMANATYINVTSLIIQGAGIGNTVITAGTTPLITYSSGGSTRNKGFRITGISFNWNGLSTYTGNAYGLRLLNYSGYQQTNVRIDHNHFYGASTSYGTHIDVVGVFGVIDHNTFERSRIPIRFSNYTSDANNYKGYTFWTSFDDMTFGAAANTMYIEDNTFNGVEYQLSDSQGGNRYSYRYNTISLTAYSDPIWDIHGNYTYGTSPNFYQMFSAYGGEFYGNQITTSYGGQLVSVRGGKALTFNNNVTSSASWTSGKLREEIRDSAAPLTNGRVQHPNSTYTWGNRRNLTTALSGLSVYENCCTSCVASTCTQHTDCCYNGAGQSAIQHNKQYWNYTSSYDGTSGVGCGTLANRPATCTEGTAYWATTQSCSSLSGMVGVSPSTPISGTLYICGSNNWVNATTYSPYTYPHPLTGADPTDTTDPVLVSVMVVGQQACPTNPSNVAISLGATDNVAVTGVRCCLNDGVNCIPATEYDDMDVVLTNTGGITWGTTVSSACDSYITYNCRATDAAGNFSNDAVIAYAMANNEDTDAPTMSTQAIGADGRTVTFTFSEAVTIGTGGSTGFTLTNGDSEEIGLTYVSGSASTSLVYQSSVCIPSTDTFTAGLVYTQPTDGIEDMAGNDLASFTGAGAKTVTNGSGQSCDLATSLFEHGESAPSGSTNASGNAVNLGVKFQTSTAGTMTHCWFYKIAADTGTHTCTVYRVFDGSTVGTVDFADESESGWQDQAFASALNIAADEDYIVTVSHPTGNWTSNVDYFASTYTNGNLTATTEGTDYAGRYVYGASMAYPINDSPRNYWVDFTMSYAGVGGPWQCTVSRTGDGCMVTGSQVVTDGNTCSATVTLRNGWKATWGGTCPAGSESGGIYTTGNLSADCTLTAACTEQNILP